MSSSLVTDLIQELKVENERLLNELLYAKQCLEVLIEFKINFDFYSNKFKQSLEINEWKKFEKLDQNISEIVSKIVNNKEKTNNNNNKSEEYVDIKTEMSFNVNINDNSNDGLNECNYDLTEEQMQRRVETNRRLKEMFVERNDNYLNDIIRQTNQDMNDYHSVLNNIEEETDIEDFTQDMSILKNSFNEGVEENSESVDYQRNSRFGDSLNEHLWQTSDELLSNDIIVTTDTKQPILSFKCDICDRSYTTKWSLGVHKRKIHKINYQNKDSDNKYKFSYQSNVKQEIGRPKIFYKCDHCDCKYINIYDLRQHKKVKHNIERRKKCPKCSKPILTDIRLKVHLNMHQNNGVFKCWHKDCDKEKYSELKAISHLHRHRVNQEMKADPNKRFKYWCEWPGCDYNAKNSCFVERHKLYVHLSDTIPLKFVCEYPGCDKKFKMKPSLDNHMKSHSTERLKCEICGKDYKTIFSLKNHIKSQHTKRKTYVCDHKDCDYQTNSNSTLYNHKINCHTSPTIVCTVDGCDKKFHNKNSLRVHLNSHNTEVTQKCPIDGCDKAYKQKSRLTIHIREQHTNSELYRCDWPGCDYQTKSGASFKSHSAVHKTERDFICEWPECGKGFKSKAQLNCHIRRHTNDKRYVCSWTGCQYSTTDSSNLIKHRKQVHEKNSH